MAPYTVRNAGSGRLHYRSRVEGGTRWVSIRDGAGSSEGQARTATVWFDTSRLAVGVHTGSITVTDVDRGATVAVPFLITVAEPVPERMVAIPGGTIGGTNPLGAGEVYGVSYPPSYTITVDPSSWISIL